MKRILPLLLVAALLAALLPACAGNAQPEIADAPAEEPAPAPEAEQTPDPAPERTPEETPEPEQPEPVPEPEQQPEEPAPEPEQPAQPASEPEQPSEPAPQPPAEPEPQEQPAPPSPEPTVPAQPEPAPETPVQPEPAEQAGCVEEADGLYYLQEDGTYLTGGSVGYLYFDADGRYTSGNTELDEGVEDVLAAAVTDPSADSEMRLREIYVYIRDNYSYLGVAHYEAGTTDWAEEAALGMIRNGKSNCYGFSALLCYCARRLGYQAYVVAGHEYSTTNEHAWTMIDWPDGVTYLFDVQLEYAYLYIYSNKPKIDMFKVSGSGVWYAGHAYYFP